MPDTQTQEVVKYISLGNLQLYDTLLKDVITKGDADSIKTVGISTDGKKLLFYTAKSPTSTTPAVFEIELPETDLTGVIAKVAGAIENNVTVFDTNGGIKDSGTKLSDIVTKTELAEAIAQAVADSTHLTKEIVTALPSVENAKPNCIYMIKDETVTDGDAYTEYMLIGAEIVPVGSTQTNLSGYYSKTEADEKIATAKSEAIQSATNTAASDATTKANKALEDAKKYTDEEIKKVTDKVTPLENAVSTNASNITTINSTLQTHSDRLTDLENSVPEVNTATEAEIRALFA